MASIIAAVIIGFIIAYLEKAMSKKSQPSTHRQQATGAGHTRPAPPRRTVPTPRVAPPTVKPEPTPFLEGENPEVPVIHYETVKMEEPSQPTFTKGQQELRRTLILGEILRRKF